MAGDDSNGPRFFDDPGLTLSVVGLAPAIWFSDTWWEYLIYAVLSIVIGNLLGYAIVKLRARRCEA